MRWKVSLHLGIHVTEDFWAMGINLADDDVQHGGCITNYAILTSWCRVRVYDYRA